MKMKQKRIIATLLAIMMLLTIPFAGVVSATDGGEEESTPAVSFTVDSLEVAQFANITDWWFVDNGYVEYDDNTTSDMLVFTSADETVLKWVVDDVENGEYFLALGAGTTTVTVTIAGTEVSDTVSVTVTPAKQISAGTGIEMTGEAFQHASYKFTVDKTAEYAIWSESKDEDSDPRLHVYTADGTAVAYDDDYKWLDFKAIAKLEAGKEYYAAIYHYDDSAYTLNIAETVEPTAIVLEQSTFDGYIGDWKFANCYVEPMNAKDVEVEYSVADPIIEFDKNWPGEFMFVKVGTTVLTATAENGLTATATVRCYAEETIELDKLVSIPTGDGYSYYVRYQFTPAESGTYYIAGIDDVNYISVSTVTWNENDGCYDYYPVATNGQWWTQYGTIVPVEMTKDTLYAIGVGGEEPTEAAVMITQDNQKIPDCIDDGHKFDEGKVVLVPTNVTEGLKQYTCSVCAHSYTEEIDPIETQSSAKTFTDIVEDKWYEEAVDFVYSSQLFKGVTETSFAPNGTMTRGMFVTVLGRLSGIAENKTATTKFTDVASGKYYTGYVAWANEAGIVNGVSDTAFAPDKNITREQICKMMVEYADYADIALDLHRGTGAFTDAKDIAGWATQYVDSCQKAGLINGIANSDGTYRFNPKGNATRAQVATILMNLADLYL